MIINRSRKKMNGAKKDKAEIRCAKFSAVKVDYIGLLCTSMVKIVIFL